MCLVHGLTEKFVERLINVGQGSVVLSKMNGFLLAYLLAICTFSSPFNVFRTGSTNITPWTAVEGRAAVAYLAFNLSRISSSTPQRVTV
jgi:hypothetical protein